MKKLIILLSACSLFSSAAYGQSVGIGTTSPHASAMLDVTSASKGLLIPRVTLTGTNDAATISSPAASLMVYNTATAGSGATAVTPGFYHWNGAAWERLLTSSGAWLLTGNAGTAAGTNFIGTTNNQALDIRTNNLLRTRITTQGQIETYNTGQSVFVGEGAGANDDLTTNQNVFVGYRAGFSNTTGDGNTASGYLALSSNTTGFNNTASGYLALYSNTTGLLNTASGGYALYSNTTGGGNTASGGYALYSNTTGGSNTASGYQALYSNTTGFSNTASGGYALYSNTTGNNNTASGRNALLSNTTGNNNTASGYQALYSNVAGSNATAIGYHAMRYANNATAPFTNYNVAVGYEALRGSATASANTGNYNTALGYQTLLSNTTGGSNTASGWNALYSNTTGFNNTASGVSALYSNTTGNYNTASGVSALYSNTTGNNNTAIGYAAGDSYAAGSFNTFLGSNTDVGAAGLSNCIAIGGNGNLAIAASNTVRIGNSSMTSIGGQVGWTTVSDMRIKKNVQENVAGLSFINALRPVSYTYDTGKENELMGINDSSSYPGKYAVEKIRFSGFLAQEVEQAAKQAGYDFSGVDKPKSEKDLYGLRYAEFVVPLVKAVQEQQQQIEELKKENDALKKETMQLKELQQEVEALKKIVQQVTAKQ